MSALAVAVDASAKSKTAFAIAEFLLDEVGMDIESRNNMGQSVFAVACAAGSVRAMRLLSARAKQAIEVNVKDKYGWTPLMAASFKEHADVVEYLVNNFNVDFNVRDASGKRAIDKA